MLLEPGERDQLISTGKQMQAVAVLASMLYRRRECWRVFGVYRGKLIFGGNGRVGGRFKIVGVRGIGGLRRGVLEILEF